jgi:signal transduction histidine kinase
MSYLINDLLDITRVKHGKLGFKRKIIDLNQSALETTEAMRGQIETKGLVLEVNLSAQPAYVDADPERFAQILDNLLRNALLYTHKGRITVTVGTTRQQAWIAVGDTGEGIEPDEAVTLFEPFRQAVRGTSAGGLGLGLTLVKQLVEMHGGTVTLHSDGHGAGSEFVITVPLARSSPDRVVAADFGSLAPEE